MRTRCFLGLAVLGLAAAGGPVQAQLAAPPAAPASAAAPSALVRLPVAADHVREADALLQQGKLPAAIESLRAALALDGSLLPVRRRLAEALAKAGRANEAKTEYERLHRAAPDASTFLYLLRARRDGGALVDAARLAQEAGQAYPADAGIAMLAADILLQLRDPRSALAHLERIPGAAGSDTLRGRAAEGAGLWAQAYAAYSRLARAGSDPLAEAGRQRALRHAVPLDRLLVFAPAGWEAVPRPEAITRYKAWIAEAFKVWERADIEGRRFRFRGCRTADRGACRRAGWPRGQRGVLPATLAERQWPARAREPGSHPQRRVRRPRTIRAGAGKGRTVGRRLGGSGSGAR